jgi:Lrp/AsnC family leucine-responsive transcriptional regulator
MRIETTHLSPTMSMKSPVDALDSTDRTILRLLQSDATLSTPQLAEQLALSTTPCWRRLKRLEEQGFISGYGARLDRRKLGLDILAFVQVTFGVVTSSAIQQFEEVMAQRPEVLACHKVTGQADYLLQVVAPSLDAYSDFVETVLRSIPGISLIHSSLALREIKASGQLPVPLVDL